MVSRKYVETFHELLEVWFKNKKQLADYDYEMLKNLARISLNQYAMKKTKTTEDKI